MEHPYCIIDIQTEYRFKGDSEWIKTEFPAELEEGKLPIQINPREGEKVCYYSFPP